MIDDLYEKFLPQFVELSKTRMERIEAGAAKADAASLTTAMRELHAIAGEAGLLGLAHLVPLARTAEEAAKHQRDARTEDNVAALGNALQELRTALDAVVAAAGKPRGGSS